MTTHDSRRRELASSWLARHALKIGLLVLVCYFLVQIPERFATIRNAEQIAIAIAILLIAASTQAVLVLMGYVDLSIGSVAGLCGVVAGLMINDGISPGLAIGTGILIGAIVGSINGLLCVYSGLSPVIVTLAGLALYRGMAQLIADTPPHTFGSVMAFLGRGSIASIPVSVLIAAIVLGAVWLFVARTPQGRHVYAIGVNAEAAHLSGVRVKRIVTLAFVVSGASAGLGGILFAARLDSAGSGSLGVGFELDVLTAVLLGGIAFTGGRGTIGGVLIGVLFLGVLKNGMLLMGVPSYWQSVASGIALIVAAGLDRVANATRVVPRASQTGNDPGANPLRPAEQGKSANPRPHEPARSAT
ncbi:ABC transporter permease [Phytohabitans kaempferiae]|uniref:ABC transporter permease n=1 Tax=Phytohabitans kaempferiae TaxID=1620943 RepID=A0ABV6LYM8_9ACTN